MRKEYVFLVLSILFAFMGFLFFYGKIRAERGYYEDLLAQKQRKEPFQKRGRIIEVVTDQGIKILEF